MLRAPGAVVVALLAGLSHGGCARAAPERLYREAETLRASYQESATRLAIAKYDAAASAWAERGQPREAAMAAQQAARSLEQLGRLHESARSYQHALALSVASADQLLESEIRSHLGTVKSFLADNDQRFAEAGEECEKALSLARQHGGQRQVAP